MTESEPADREPQPAYYGLAHRPLPNGHPAYSASARPDHAPPRPDRYPAERSDRAATDRYSSPPPGRLPERVSRRRCELPGAPSVRGHPHLGRALAPISMGLTSARGPSQNGWGPWLRACAEYPRRRQRMRPPRTPLRRAAPSAGAVQGWPQHGPVSTGAADREGGRGDVSLRRGLADRPGRRPAVAGCAGECGARRPVQAGDPGHGVRTAAPGMLSGGWVRG